MTAEGAGPGKGVVAHLARDGTELWRANGFGRPVSVTADSHDGSCWVGDQGFWDEVAGAYRGVALVHLSASGSELTRTPGFAQPTCVSANPADGSCWVTDQGVWDGTYAGTALVHVAPDGSELWRGTAFSAPSSVSTNPTDGSCWVADTEHKQVVHVSATGDELWRVGGYERPVTVSVNAADGSCWVGDTERDELVHLSEDWFELWRGGLPDPSSVSVNPTDNSCWVATPGGVIHVRDDGVTLSQVNTLCSWAAVSVDPTDGSCWVADTLNGQVVHLVALPEPTFPDIPVVHWAYHEVEACAAAGIVTGYPNGTYQPTLLVTRAQMAVYISRALVIPSGDVAIPFPEPPPSFSDVPTDHWAYKWVEYAASRNVVQGYPGAAYHPDEVVNRGQMAVYIARSIVSPPGDPNVPDPTGPPAFPDVTAENEWAWCYKHVQHLAGLDPPVVQGYWDGTYRPAVEVTRDQMAVYVTRAFQLPM